MLRSGLTKIPVNFHECTLCPNPQNFTCARSPEAQSLEGTYLYLDKNSGWWVRSGKAVGRSFVERHDEHKKASQLTEVSTRESKFYTSYPSKTAELACDASRRGYFDNLEQLVAFGFDWATEGAIDGLTADAADGGIFDFSEGKKKRIERVNFQGENTLKG